MSCQPLKQTLPATPQLINWWLCWLSLGTLNCYSALLLMDQSAHRKASDCLSSCKDMQSSALSKGPCALLMLLLCTCPCHWAARCYPSFICSACACQPTISHASSMFCCHKHSVFALGKLCSHIKLQTECFMPQSLDGASKSAMISCCHLVAAEC